MKEYTLIRVRGGLIDTRYMPYFSIYMFLKNEKTMSLHFCMN